MSKYYTELEKLLGVQTLTDNERTALAYGHRKGREDAQPQKIKDLIADRNEWKQQHENLLSVRQSDLQVIAKLEERIRVAGWKDTIDAQHIALGNLHAELVDSIIASLQQQATIDQQAVEIHRLNELAANRLIGLCKCGDELEHSRKRVMELEAIIKASQEQEPVEIECPEYHEQGMGCGLEDRCITDRYEAMRYGWDCAIKVMMFGIIPEPLYAAPVIKEQP